MKSLKREDYNLLHILKVEDVPLKVKLVPAIEAIYSGVEMNGC